MGLKFDVLGETVCLTWEKEDRQNIKAAKVMPDRVIETLVRRFETRWPNEKIQNRRFKGLHFYKH
jgi:hypothetical protein